MALIVINRRQTKLSANVTGRRTAKNKQSCKGRLKAAEAFMKAGNSEKFYEKCFGNALGYICLTSFQCLCLQLSRENISSTLASKGYSEESTAEACWEVLDDCEMAIFTPDSSSGWTKCL